MGQKAVSISILFLQDAKRSKANSNSKFKIQNWSCISTCKSNLCDQRSFFICCALPDKAQALASDWNGPSNALNTTCQRRLLVLLCVLLLRFHFTSTFFSPDIPLMSTTFQVVPPLSPANTITRHYLLCFSAISQSSFANPRCSPLISLVIILFLWLCKALPLS